MSHIEQAHSRDPSHLREVHLAYAMNTLHKLHQGHILGKVFSIRGWVKRMSPSVASLVDFMYPEFIACRWRSRQPDQVSVQCVTSIEHNYFPLFVDSTERPHSISDYKSVSFKCSCFLHFILPFSYSTYFGVQNLSVILQTVPYCNLTSDYQNV